MVDTNVEHLGNLEILHNFEVEEETEPSLEEDLTYDALTEDVNNIAEGEHTNLENEEETLSVISEVENDVLNEDSVEETLPESDATEEKEITDSQTLESNKYNTEENENNVTEEEAMNESKIQESNNTEENSPNKKLLEGNFYDDNIKDIIPEKDGLLKRLTKCFFSRQSA